MLLLLLLVECQAEDSAVSGLTTEAVRPNYMALHAHSTTAAQHQKPISMRKPGLISLAGTHMKAPPFEKNCEIAELSWSQIYVPDSLHLKGARTLCKIFFHAAVIFVLFWSYRMHTHSLVLNICIFSVIMEMLFFPLSLKCCYLQCGSYK